VIHDEGLRSYKAIAFIQSESRTRVSSRPFSYLELGATPSRNVLSLKPKTVRILSKNLGEKIYG